MEGPRVFLNSQNISNNIISTLPIIDNWQFTPSAYTYEGHNGEIFSTDDANWTRTIDGNRYTFQYDLTATTYPTAPTITMSPLGPFIIEAGSKEICNTYIDIDPNNASVNDIQVVLPDQSVYPNYLWYLRESDIHTINLTSQTDTILYSLATSTINKICVVTNNIIGQIKGVTDDPIFMISFVGAYSTFNIRSSITTGVDWDCYTLTGSTFMMVSGTSYRIYSTSSNLLLESYTFPNNIHSVTNIRNGVIAVNVSFNTFVRPQRTNGTWDNEIYTPSNASAIWSNTPYVMVGDNSFNGGLLLCEDRCYEIDITFSGSDPAGWYLYSTSNPKPIGTITSAVAYVPIEDQPATKIFAVILNGSDSKVYAMDLSDHSWYDAGWRDFNGANGNAYLTQSVGPDFGPVSSAYLSGTYIGYIPNVSQPLEVAPILTDHGGFSLPMNAANNVMIQTGSVTGVPSATQYINVSSCIPSLSRFVPNGVTVVGSNIQLALTNATQSTSPDLLERTAVVHGFTNINTASGIIMHNGSGGVMGPFKLKGFYFNKMTSFHFIDCTKSTFVSKDTIAILVGNTNILYYVNIQDGSVINTITSVINFTYSGNGYNIYVGQGDPSVSCAIMLWNPITDTSIEVVPAVAKTEATIFMEMASSYNGAYTVAYFSDNTSTKIYLINGTTYAFKEVFSGKAESPLSYLNDIMVYSTNREDCYKASINDAVFIADATGDISGTNPMTVANGYVYTILYRDNKDQLWRGGTAVPNSAWEVVIDELIEFGAIYSMGTTRDGQLVVCYHQTFSNEPVWVFLNLDGSQQLGIPILNGENADISMTTNKYGISITCDSYVTIELVDTPVETSVGILGDTMIGDGSTLHLGLKATTVTATTVSCHNQIDTKFNPVNKITFENDFLPKLTYFRYGTGGTTAISDGVPIRIIYDIPIVDETGNMDNGYYVNNETYPVNATIVANIWITGNVVTLLHDLSVYRIRNNSEELISTSSYGYGISTIYPTLQITTSCSLEPGDRLAFYTVVYGGDTSIRNSPVASILQIVTARNT